MTISMWETGGNDAVFTRPHAGTVSSSTRGSAASAAERPTGAGPRRLTGGTVERIVAAMPQPVIGSAVRLGTAKGRWLLAATVVGSGIAFLDTTVVNAALPPIREDLGGGLAGLQWMLTAYLVTLTSMLVLGGSLGDLYGRRRIFVIGLTGFAVRRRCARRHRPSGSHRRPTPPGRGRGAAGTEEPGHDLGLVSARGPRPVRSGRGPASARSRPRSVRSSAAG